MKRLLVLLALLAMLAVAIVPAIAQDDCMDEIGCVELAPDDPITIGYILALSGPVAPYGEDSKGSIEIAVNDRDGELLGHEIDLVEGDELCSAEGGQTAAQQLASDDILLGVIGTTCSGGATGAMPIISEAGMVMISASATSPSLTNPDPDTGGVWVPGFYRTAHNDVIQGAMDADFAFNVLGATTLATIHDGDAYTDGLQQAMADRFEELGGEVVYQGAINKGDEDMTAILTEVASFSPDVLFFPIFEPEGPRIIAQAADIAGLEDTVLFSADGMFTNTMAASSGENVIGMYLSGPRLAGDRYDELLAKWDDQLGMSPPSGFHAHAYDATNMLLDAIEEVAVVADDGSITIGRQALRDALNSVEDFDGITGNLTCNEYGDCATGEALAIYEIGQEEFDGNWPAPVVYTVDDAEESSD